MCQDVIKYLCPFNKKEVVTYDTIHDITGVADLTALFRVGDEVAVADTACRACHARIVFVTGRIVEIARDHLVIQRSSGTTHVIRSGGPRTGEPQDLEDLPGIVLTSRGRIGPPSAIDHMVRWQKRCPEQPWDTPA